MAELDDDDTDDADMAMRLGFNATIVVLNYALVYWPTLFCGRSKNSVHEVPEVEERILFLPAVCKPTHPIR
jgi:hypothetical protein